MDEKSGLLTKAAARDESEEERNINYAFHLFKVIGFSYLFTCFALVQPVDYWRQIFPTVSAEFEISWTYNLASVATLLVLVESGMAPSYVKRVVGAYAVIVLFMVILTASHFVLASQMTKLAAVLGCTAVISIAISALDSTVLSLASLFPLGAMHHTQVGVGIASFVSALCRVATKAFFPPDSIVESTMLFFGLAIVNLAAGLLAFFLLLRLPVTQHCIHDVAKAQVIDHAVCSKIWFKAAMVAISFGCTYVLYPSVLSMPSYSYPWLNANEWWPLILTMLYAGCEVIGRWCVQWRLATHETIWMAVAPRLLLIPLLVLRVKWHWLPHDTFSLLWVVLLGTSHGYCGTLAVVVMNDSVEAHEQSVTGMIASLAINMGILGGSTLRLLASFLPEA
ncbi:unnamed protein product [Aphanomyces euteiches]|uniref:Uncharacterized protein n=1 Tax=Aphanomyces euteiches TaxID=100861 RepID=A0A6G0X450_9STRA|nr:hypothetical protein Ae201684_008686 [Aphanomyces euteiches]KAH9085963.1 hypothetical protein Ae201684P_005659 [Aphanomyces euteiches]